MHPKLAAGLAQAWHSLQTTAAALGVVYIGLAANAQITAHNITASGTSDPAHFWAFTQANYFPFLLSQVLVPLLRGASAAAKA